MADIVTSTKRSLMMAGIKGKNTRPEILIRSGLHRLGFRFRIHDKSLPGKPDLKFVKFKAVIFVHGCFWHRHECHLFKMPSTRTEFWEEKFKINEINDIKNRKSLEDSGWRVGIIWECALKGKSRLDLEEVLNSSVKWLKLENSFLEIKGFKV